MKSLSLSFNFCPLLLTFANSLDPDQDQHFDTLKVFLEDLIEKVNFEKKSADDINLIKSMKNYPACKELKFVFQLS